MLKARERRRKAKYDKETLLRFYRALLYPRLIEEKMLLLLRQGRISKWFSGIGQEAISVAATLAMHEDEYVLPLHRNLGVFTTRGCPFQKLMAQWQGKVSGFSQGRERSFHFGTKEHHIVGMISHLGPQLGIADGIALADALMHRKKATLVFSGEGGTSEGDFHESLNVAAVWNLPVIFLVENNGYALSTPVSEQFRCKSLSERAVGYGMEGLTIDGNNFFEVYETVDRVAKDIRENPRPVLIECMTFRMRGHEEASGTKYVPKDLVEEWAKRDPLLVFEERLRKEGVLTDKISAQLRREISQELEAGIEAVFAEPEITPDSDYEQSQIYCPHNFISQVPEGALSSRRYVDAISDGLRAGLKKYPELIIMGQDVAEYGGVFKVTEGFLAEFGRERIRNTPLCESAIVGAALGYSIKGGKSVVEMQFSDFVTCGFNQIVNNLAKIYYRWGANADVVVRMPTGAGVGAGPFHSQSTEAWFCHTPGLKVVYPATAYDAKGLMISSIEDPNPIMFFEHKLLYRSVKEEIPDGYYNIEIGKARVVSQGEQAAIVTYGLGVHWATELQKRRPELSLYILDLRTLLPYDKQAINLAVKRTGRVLVLHEACLTGGIGAELSAYITENLFSELDAPVMRCASLDTPVPFSGALEKNFMAGARFEAALNELLSY